MDRMPGGKPGLVPAEQPWESAISGIRHTRRINATAHGQAPPEGPWVCAIFTSGCS